MVQIGKSVLYIGPCGTESIGWERALVSGGLSVASVTAPESAVNYVKNCDVRVVLISDQGEFDVSMLAACLKIASPQLRIIALGQSNASVDHVDTVVEKPVSLEALVSAVQENLFEYESASNS